MNMNEIKLIESAFNFLVERGCSLSSQKTNLEYCVTYSFSNKKIILNYDLRLHRFDVGIQSTKNMDEYGLYYPLLELNIGGKSQRQELIDRIEALNVEVENDRIISKKHFCAILDAYAEFVKRNIDEIMTQS